MAHRAISPARAMQGRAIPATAKPPATRPGQPADTAARIRDAYIRMRRRHICSLSRSDTSYGTQPNPRWDGGQTDDGRHYKSLWPKIASMLASRDCKNIERFVAVQFEGDAPPPNMLLSDDAWTRYTQRNANIDFELQHQFEIEGRVFTSKFAEAKSFYPDLSDAEGWSRVLLDPNSGLTPLFRYCIADHEGMTEIAAKFYDAALEQLLTDVAGYSKHWSRQLPPTILRHAERILAQEETQ